MKLFVGLVLSCLYCYAGASIIEVDRADDLQIANDGGCDLRDAVTAANFNFAVGSCDAGETGNADIIIITVPGPIQLENELDILAGVRITAPFNYDGTITIMAAANERIFEVHPTSASSNSFEMNKLRLVNGNPAAGDGGAVVFYRYNDTNLGQVYITDSVFEGNQAAKGGAIAFDDSHASDVTILSSEFINNQATDGTGGAISVENATDGEMTVNFNLFQSNTATASGGAVFVAEGGELPFEFKRNQFFNNLSGTDGGAVSLWGIGGNQEYLLERNAFVGNTAASYGGALSANLWSRARVINSVMAFNMADRGGAMASISQAYIYLRFSTLVFNEANLGGHIYGYSGSLGTLSGNIMAHSIGASNCAGDLNALSSNLSIYDDSSCPFNVSTDRQEDPLLSGIRYNEHGWPAFVPASNSSAIDKISDAACKDYSQNSVVFDGQNSPRPIDGNGDNNALCDIGAIEVPVGHDLIWSDGFGG